MYKLEHPANPSSFDPHSDIIDFPNLNLIVKMVAGHLIWKVSALKMEGAGSEMCCNSEIRSQPQLDSHF